EQALRLGALREAERGREVVAVGAIQVAERATQLGLQPGPARRWQGAGPDRIGDEGDIDLGHFMSHLRYVTYFVTICNYDVKCQLCSLRPIGYRRAGRPRRPAREGCSLARSARDRAQRRTPGRRDGARACGARLRAPRRDTETG